MAAVGAARDRAWTRAKAKLLWHASDKLFDLSRAATEALPPSPGRRRHGLPAPLVVSLTSYPPRYASLKPTLKRLLSQTVVADRLILWLTETDRAALPPEIATLSRYGLEIRETPETGPHKKYLEARRRFPEAYIVTVDDDMAYKPTMLAELVGGLAPPVRSVVAHRARRIVLRGEAVAPYWEWPLLREGPAVGDDLLATGSGGVLYPPGALPEAVLDEALLKQLSPRTDDLWLHWMVRRAGYTTTLVARPNRAREWNESQEVALWSGVNRDENDAAIARLTAEFGPILRAGTIATYTKSR